MRKSRKSAIVKRIVTRSVAGGHSTKFVSTFGGGLNNTAELSLMAREEWEQRLVDNFWGLDKDLKDRNQEIALMWEEDIASAEFEEQLRIQQLHEIWDQEFFHQEKQRKNIERHQWAIQRTDHLKLINSPLPVENILQLLWSPESSNFDITDYIPSVLKDGSTLNEPSMTQTAGGGSGTGLDSVHMSMHLEGLQRSREIVDSAKTSFRKILKDLKQSDFSSSKPSVVTLTGRDVTIASSGRNSPTNPLGAGGGSILSSLPNEMRGSSIFSSDETKQGSPKNNKSVYSVVQEVSNALGLSSQSKELAKMPVYNDALEGHPLYKWDQEMMIQLVFNMLDQNNKGYLTKEDLSVISHDLNIHELLKYTVFWSVIKRREWTIFENLFHSEDSLPAAPNSSNNAPHSRHSNFPAPLQRGKSNVSVRSSVSEREQRLTTERSERGGGNVSGAVSGFNTARIGDNPSIHALSSSAAAVAIAHYYRSSSLPKDTISYFQFLDCALALSKESRCPISMIRTQEEHEYFSSFSSSSVNQHNNGQKVSFPSTYWDNDNNGILRNFRIMRKLTVGDCVWALHRKGVRWLPAVIMKIYYPKSNFTGSRPPQQNDDNMSVVTMNEESNQTDKKKKKPKNDESFYYYYDLWFPLSEKELTKARMTTISKQLLTLPSQASLVNNNPAQSIFSSSSYFEAPDASSSNMMNASNPFNNSQTNNNSLTRSINGYPPLPTPGGSRVNNNNSLLFMESEENIYANALPCKPFDLERQVCSYAFDLIDSNSCGIINLLVLIQSMQSKELIQIVNSSLILSLIFRTNQSLEDILLSKDETLSLLIELELQTLQQQKAQAATNSTANTSNKSGKSNNNQNSSVEEGSIESLFLMQREKDKKRRDRDVFDLPCFLPVFVDTFTANELHDEHHDELDRLREMQQEYTKHSTNNSLTHNKPHTTLGFDRNSQVEKLHEEEDALKELRQQEREYFAPQQSRNTNNNHYGASEESSQISYLNDFNDSSTILNDTDSLVGTQLLDTIPPSTAPASLGNTLNNNNNGSRRPSNSSWAQQEAAELKRIEEENVKYIKLQKKITQISTEFISKMDFLEFCDCIYNIIKYDIYWNHFNYDDILKKLPPPFEKYKRSTTRRVVYTSPKNKKKKNPTGANSMNNNNTPGKSTSKTSPNHSLTFSAESTNNHSAVNSPMKM